MCVAAGLILDQATVAFATYLRIVTVRVVEVILVVPAAYFGTRIGGVGGALALALVALVVLAAAVALVQRDALRKAN